MSMMMRIKKIIEKVANKNNIYLSFSLALSSSSLTLPPAEKTQYLVHLSLNSILQLIGH